MLPAMTTKRIPISVGPSDLVFGFPHFNVIIAVPHLRGFIPNVRMVRNEEKKIQNDPSPGAIQDSDNDHYAH